MSRLGDFLKRLDFTDGWATALGPREFLEWLPWYVNGTLDAATRDRMQAYVIEHAEGRQLASGHDILRFQMVTLGERIPRDIGLERAMRAIQTSV